MAKERLLKFSNPNLQETLKKLYSKMLFKAFLKKKPLKNKALK